MKRSRESEEASSEETVSTIRNTAVMAGISHDGLIPSNRDGSNTLQPPAKLAELDLPDNDRGVQMLCSLPPHKEPLVFSSYGEYEMHYRNQHTNRCAQCRKNFPSAHLLGLHIEETHDSFVLVKRERGERTYSCFVESCERKCSTPQKRKMHLIDKHMYPKNFFFAVTRDGIDGRRSLLLEGGHRHKRSSAAAAPRPKESSREERHKPSTADEKSEASTDDHMAVDPGVKSPGPQADHEMEDLSNAMSALRFVPLSVQFGRGKRTGFAKR
ncbi:Zinc finger protein 511 [Madurella fahalii]|uniref:Zinc finger protein 511 n=1 Tax=Madurella fahalii TaxID=1157608 RepID=A0ABQ0GR09_9PEZI